MLYRTIAAAAAVTLMCSSAALAQTALEKPPSAMPGQSKDSVTGGPSTGHGPMTNNGAMASAMKKRATTGSPLTAGNSAGMSGEKDTVTGHTTDGTMTGHTTATGSPSDGSTAPLSGEKSTMAPASNSGAVVGGGSHAEAGN